MIYEMEKKFMTPVRLIMVAAALLGAVSLQACTPTVNLNVNMSPIYAKLDVNVRVQLDQDVKALVSQNPNLF